MSCWRCNEGLVMVCPDDLCRGADECLGARYGRRIKNCFRECPECKGDYAAISDEDDYEDVIEDETVTP